jgi:hypothetical protein
MHTDANSDKLSALEMKKPRRARLSNAGGSGEIDFVETAFSNWRPIDLSLWVLRGRLRPIAVGKAGENPCVGDSIPPRTTKNHSSPLVVLFSFVTTKKKYSPNCCLVVNFGSLISIFALEL